MSFIVKGMEMPKNCVECKLYTTHKMCTYRYYGKTVIDYFCRIAHQFMDYDTVHAKNRPNFCPLVEIPTPHGRLIDADEIEYENWYLEETGESYKIVGKDDIDGMSAIIEAEGSE